jgi:hypothetical protein
MWKKLDFSPSSRESDDVDVDAELEEIATRVRQAVKDSPQPVRRSLFQKIKEVFNPGGNTKKPPVVVKNRRGRPTKKAQEEKTATAARASSFTSSVRESPEFSYEPPRYSSYVPPTHRKKQTEKDSVTSGDSGISAPKGDLRFPLMKKGHPETYRYRKQIPKVFYPYVSNITDVIPDGHCGFRCFSLALLGNQDQYMTIRDQLLQELRINEAYWRFFFDTDPEADTKHYDNICTTIQFRGVGGCSSSNWCEMPECGFIISNLYRIPVITVDVRGTSTLFPMNQGPADNDEDVIVPIVYVDKGHFILLTLQGSFPMPTIDPRCKTYGVVEAKLWETKYSDRIEEYKRIVFPKKDPNVPPETVNVD